MSPDDLLDELRLAWERYQRTLDRTIEHILDSTLGRPGLSWPFVQRAAFEILARAEEG